MKARTHTEYYLCHFDDGSACWVLVWRGMDALYTCYSDDGRIQHEPGYEITRPQPEKYKTELRITRKLARCLIRSWRKG